MRNKLLIVVHVVALSVLLLSILACQDTSVNEEGEFPAPGGRIQHIMPWPAGSGSDIAMRGFLRFVEDQLGSRIYTENIAGGLSARGLLRTQMASADGYTIGTMTYDVLTVEFFELVPVTWRDFDILGAITEHPSALISRADRWSNLPEFHSEAASRSVRLKVGNVGSGGVFHQHAAAMEKELGVDFLHVPYTSTSGQLSALLGREIDAIVASLPVVLPYVQEGSLRVLGVMASERHPLLPDAPTFLEGGLDVVYGSFRMLVVPKGVDEEVRSVLERAVFEASQDSTFQDWAARSAVGASWRGPEESRAYLEDLSPRVRTLIETMHQ